MRFDCRVSPPLLYGRLTQIQRLLLARTRTLWVLGWCSRLPESFGFRLLGSVGPSALHRLRGKLSTAPPSILQNRKPFLRTRAPSGALPSGIRHSSCPSGHRSNGLPILRCLHWFAERVSEKR